VFEKDLGATLAQNRSSWNLGEPMKKKRAAFLEREKVFGREKNGEGGGQGGTITRGGGENLYVSSTKVKGKGVSFRRGKGTSGFGEKRGKGKRHLLVCSNARRGREKKGGGKPPVVAFHGKSKALPAGEGYAAPPTKKGRGEEVKPL